MNKLASSVATMVLLSGCATYSFAPPSVSTTKIIRLNGSDTVDGKPCSFATAISGRKGEIWETVFGARLTINNFVLKYRCSYRELANGRRNFEIPAFISAVGGAAAAAFGAGSSVAIGTGAGAVVFNGGKSYFAPREKAAMLNKALDALLCIKAVSVGVTPFTLDDKQDSKPVAAGGEQPGAEIQHSKKGESVGAAVETGAGLSTDDNNKKHSPSIQISSVKQYYDMVLTAVLSVERIVADRLSNAGKDFDAEGILSQIKDLQKATEAAQAKADSEKLKADGQPATPATPSIAVAAGTGTPQANATAAVNGLAAQNVELALKNNLPASAIDAKSWADTTVSQEARRLKHVVEYNTQLDLNVMQPKLKQCVVRAKL